MEPVALVTALGSGFPAVGAASVFFSTLAWMEIKRDLGGGGKFQTKMRAQMPRKEEGRKRQKEAVTLAPRTTHTASEDPHRSLSEGHRKKNHRPELKPRRDHAFMEK